MSSHKSKSSAKAEGSGAGTKAALRTVTEVEDLTSTPGLWLLVASASWCAPCQVYKPAVACAGALITGVQFATFSVQDSEDLADLFKIKSIPATLVVDVERGTGKLTLLYSAVGGDKLAPALVALSQAFTTKFSEGVRPPTNIVAAMSPTAGAMLQQPLHVLFRGVEVVSDPTLGGSTMEVRLKDDAGEGSGPVPGPVSGPVTRVVARAAGIEALVRDLHSVYFDAKPRK